ncbi:hypothetical protein [Flavobacterium frigidarium]|uniref:hypothetical protein n=1 Tax=Flavobacterium frigidarium TaxID=99286 RepID=UPI0003FEB65C|nr:hypothetical protein [Flavobacterium frigidarium]
MKRIKFDNVAKSWPLITLMLISILCLIFGTFEIIEFANPKLNKRLAGTGSLIQVLFYFRMFWFRNYVQWTKKGALIRIKSFWGETIQFDELSHATLEHKNLKIFNGDAVRYEFDLRDFEREDAEKLHTIINQNC